mgnify:CR=1 FL=1
MPELSRTQMVVYAAVAIALLLVGARAIRGAEGGRAPFAVADAPPMEGGFSTGGQAGDLVVDVAGAVRDPGV